MNCIVDSVLNIYQIMEPWQRDHITKQKTNLIDLTVCNNVLLNELVARGILAKIEYQQLMKILANGGEIDQATALYDLLVTRSNAYDTLIDVLELPTVNQHAVAKILRDGKPLPKLDQVSITKMAPRVPPRNYGANAYPSGTASGDAVDGNDISDYTNSAVHQRLEVQVELPTPEMRRNVEDRDYYKLPSEDKGIALILNIIRFDKYELKEGEPVDSEEPSGRRDGAQCDATYMRNLWKALGYKIFREDEIDFVEGRWYKKDLLKIIEDFRAFCNEHQPNSIVVYIGSHGEHDKIFTSDPPSKRQAVWNGDEYGYKYTREKVSLSEDIVQPFYHLTCPGLKGKPKIFLVNACQIFSRTEMDSVLECPVSDLIVCTAQAPGFVAWRNTGRGSWFTHCFTYVVMKYAREKSMQEMLRLVGNMMKNLRGDTAHMVLDGEMVPLPYGQIPEIRDVGMEELYLL